MVNLISIFWFRLIVIISFSFIFYCKGSNLSKNEKLNLAYLNENCMSCHTAFGKARIAPGFAEIKEVYLSETKEKFTKSIIHYTSHPNAEQSKKKEWIQQYGIMPLIIFSTDRLTRSLEYLYSTDFGSEDWKKRTEEFLKKPEIGRKMLEEDMTLIEKGQLAAMKTKSILGSNLMTSIKEKGVPGAIEFCNTKAIPITHEMSTQLKVVVSRVSDKPRNVNNIANEKEKEIIEKYSLLLKDNQTLEPMLWEEGSKKITYFPIVTNAMCLKCHGQSIEADVKDKILKLYPKDMATGYTSDQIRGLYKVEL